jgi:hypothetical protein
VEKVFSNGEKCFSSEERFVSTALNTLVHGYLVDEYNGKRRDRGLNPYSDKRAIVFLL